MPQSRTCEGKLPSWLKAPASRWCLAGGQKKREFVSR